MQALSPWDLVKDFGLSEGNILLGEFGFEQLAHLRLVADGSRCHSLLMSRWECALKPHPRDGSMRPSGRGPARATTRKATTVKGIR